MSAIQLLLLVVLSAIAIVASIHALRTHQAYGVFRLFAFETLAILIVWNANRWFRQPFSVQQIVSWIIMASATVLAAHGIYLLKVVGRAQVRIMEDTQILVEIGAYRYIRHPLYSSLVLFGWGVFFKGIDLPSAAFVIATTVLFVATARYEENFNIECFGAVYSDYIKRTKMFIPLLL